MTRPSCWILGFLCAALALPAPLAAISSELPTLARELDHRLVEAERQLSTLERQTGGESRELDQIRDELRRIRGSMGSFNAGVTLVSGADDRAGADRFLAEGRRLLREVADTQSLIARFRQTASGAAITLRRLRQARRVQTQAREALSKLPRARSQGRFRIAQDSLEQGRQAFEAGGVVQARNLIERAIRLFQEVINAAKLYHELEREMIQLDHRVEEAGRTGASRAGNSLQRARQALDSARRSLATENLPAARAQVRQARELVEDYGREESGRADKVVPVDRTRVQVAEILQGPPPPTVDIDQARSSLEKARLDPPSSGSLSARLLKEAQDLLEKASLLEGTGQATAARANSRLARRLIERAEQAK